MLSVVEGARTVYIGGYFEAELVLQTTDPVEVPEIVSSYDHYVNKVYFPVVFGNGSAGLGMTAGNFGNTYYHTHPSPTGQSWITWRMYYSVGSTNIAMRVQGNSESYELHYMLADHLGGTVRTIRQDGLASELRYSAWGETRWTSGTTPTEKQYTGQYKAEAGLYFYQSRFYDGSLGRFISPDTIIPGPYYSLSWDRYAGMINNPIVHNDPSGHCIDGLTTAVCIVGGAMILGAIGGYAYQVYENRMSGMSLGEALTTNISAEKVLQGAVIGGGVVVGAATLSAGLAAVGITGAAACTDGDCTNEISTLTRADLPAVDRFAQRATKINVDRGYGSFGSFWSELAKSMGNSTNMFINRSGNEITGMMKISTQSARYEIKYLEGVGNGAGTNLFMRAIRDSLVKGYNGIYLAPSEKALQWYLTNFPGAVTLENGYLYWSADVLKNIVEGK